MTSNSPLRQEHDASSSAEDGRAQRQLLGRLSQACLRHDEHLDINTMTSGEPGDAENALSQPMVEVTIRQQTPGEGRPLHLATVELRPSYSDDRPAGPVSESTLEATLTGYVVRTTFFDQDIDGFPPYDFDFESYGLVVWNDMSQWETIAQTENSVSLNEGVDQLIALVETIRDHRET